MLIIGTKKSRSSCCGECQEGKPCADKKFVAQPSGLLLPDRRIVSPRSMLYGSPGELEGVRASWNRPLLMPQFDMSCLPCCGFASCTGDSHGYATVALTEKTNDCTCLPDTLLSGPNPWTTSSCPGNPNWYLQCHEEVWKFWRGVADVTHVSNVFATMLDYTFGVEIVFQLPEMGANCGGAGGSAVATIT